MFALLRHGICMLVSSATHELQVLQASDDSANGQSTLTSKDDDTWDQYRDEQAR